MLALVAIAIGTSSFGSEPIIWKLRDHQLRWAKEREVWERTAQRLARQPEVNLHLSKVESATAAYFEAVVAGNRVIEHCLLLLRGKDGKKPAKSFVLMTRTPYEGTGEWGFAWSVVEHPPKDPLVEGVLPVVINTTQAQIWKLLEDFDACPSSQTKEIYAVAACVVFGDVWDPFLSEPEPSKKASSDPPARLTADPFAGSLPLDESKLKQPELKEHK